MNASIKKKIDVLKASELFINNNCLTEKQSILLTLTGQKPVSEVTTGKKETTSTGWKSVPENHSIVRDFLHSLGLQCSIEDHGSATNAIISLDSSLIEQYLDSTNLGTNIGALFGYPKTATEAFGDNDLMMGLDEQDEIMSSEGLPLFMPNFRFSKLHFKKEIEVLKAWHDTLKRYDFA